MRTFIITTVACQALMVLLGLWMLTRPKLRTVGAFNIVLNIALGVLNWSLLSLW